MVTLFYSLNYFSRFRDFKEELYQFFPKLDKLQLNYENSVNITEEIDKNIINNKDLPLRACRLYVQGETCAGIKQKFGLKHPEQAHRVLQKGIKQLLISFEGKNPNETQK